MLSAHYLRTTNIYEYTNELRIRKFISIRNSLVFLASWLLLLGSFSAQNNATMQSGSQKENHILTIKDNRKVLVIPFNPKLYMSEIDRSINRETNQSFTEIRHTFRVGLDFNVLAELKKTFSAASLMLDTLKTFQDLNMIYKGIDYKYDPVPATNKGKVKTDNYNAKSQINGGQIVVKVDETARFMNTTVTNPSLLSILQKKYGADLYVFVNELDIKNEIDNSGIAMTNDYKRVIAVHYTVMDATGKVITGGLATDKFASTLNTPKKIIAEHFSTIGNEIHEQMLTALNLKPAEKVEEKRKPLDIFKKTTK